MAARTERPRVAIATNVDWYFWSHRLPIARALRDAGCEVLVVAGEERGYGPRIESEGFRFLPIDISRGSTDPSRELAALRGFYRHYRRERPLLVHHVAQKAVIYGSMAARLARVPAIINAIAGTGSAGRAPGIRGNVLRRLMRAAYGIAFGGNSTRAIFQNVVDMDAAIAGGIVPRNRSVLIRGSGVDTTRFAPVPPPAGTPVIAFASRLLWSKGLGELAEASRALRARGVTARFVVAGAPDAENPECIPESQVRDWAREGLIEWIGETDDMPGLFRQAHIAVLPSWDEGAPKVLLEAAAAGLPIVATDIPGCRQIVEPGVNGLLVPRKNPAMLADALELLVRDADSRRRMGAESRKIALRDFDERIVVQQTLAVYRELLGAKWPRS